MLSRRLNMVTLLAPAVLLLIMADIIAEVPAEKIGNVRELPAQPHPHWVWINDVSFTHLEAGRAYLVDGDTGDMLGMLSTGIHGMVLALPSDYRAIYSPETYWSRGTRGTRTDVVTVYDAGTLFPVDEIEIPAKRAETIPTTQNATLTDDDRFLAIYNYTPAQTISLVDVRQRRFIREIDSSGCAMVYALGSQALASICSDGTLLVMELDENGQDKKKYRTGRFFDPEHDFVSEKAVRHGNQWLFLSVNGYIHPVSYTHGREPLFHEKWSLLSDSERTEEWVMSGLQPLAVHQRDARLYVLMHQGHRDSYKDPGNEIWVYDLTTEKRIRKIRLKELATAIQVSQDNKPLLFTVFAAYPELMIYDAVTGSFLRKVIQLGQTPTILLTPVAR